jgi:hypothetical protein
MSCTPVVCVAQDLMLVHQPARRSFQAVCRSRLHLPQATSGLGLWLGWACSSSSTSTSRRQPWQGVQAQVLGLRWRCLQVGLRQHRAASCPAAQASSAAAVLQVAAMASTRWCMALMQVRGARWLPPGQGHMTVLTCLQSLVDMQPRMPFLSDLVARSPQACLQRCLCMCVQQQSLPCNHCCRLQQQDLHTH